MEEQVLSFADMWEDPLNKSKLNLTEEDIRNEKVNMVVPIIGYGVMFLIAATGNVTVFISLVREQRKSRVCLLLIHLSIADLIVTFLMIPMEIMWRITNQWVAGNVMCKIFMVIRAFGPYLSSNVLVCITLDRYFAILYPFTVGNAKRRGKIMLTVAWIVSFACAFPQSIIFNVLQHPLDLNFYQCVTFGSFANDSEETLYNLFCLATVYFVPLSVIIFSYTCILCEISTNSGENIKYKKGDKVNDGTKILLRRSDRSTMERAKSRTFKMTITIVAAFIWCWTPYVVMTLWYAFDRSSAQNVDKHLQEILFLMAVSNSSMNPLVYGSYVLKMKISRRRSRFYLKTRWTSRSQSENQIHVSHLHQRPKFTDTTELSFSVQVKKF